MESRASPPGLRRHRCGRAKTPGSPLTSAALQSGCGPPPKSEDHAGDDQVGALDLRAPVCGLRSHACGRRLSGASAAAWIAVRGSLARRVLVLTAAVTLWVGGFHVIYRCQDQNCDRSHDLHSLPLYPGIRNALVIARLFHIVMLGLLVALVVTFGLGKLAIAGVIAVAALLLYEHMLVRHDDLSKLNAAFFTMNGVISVVFFFFVAGDLLLRHG